MLIILVIILLFLTGLKLFAIITSPFISCFLIATKSELINSSASIRNILLLRAGIIIG